MSTFPHWNWNGQAPIGNDKGTRLAFARNRDQRGNPGALELFYTGTNNNLHHVRQAIAADSSSWQEQSPFTGTSAKQIASAKEIAVGQDNDGRLELVYVGTNNELYRNRQVAAGSLEWEGQTSPFGKGKANQIAIALDGLGRLEIVYVGADNHIYHDRQAAPGSANWVGQTLFPGLSAKQVAIERNPNDHNLLEVFYIGTNDGLFNIRQLDTGGMNDWTNGKDRFANDSAKQVAVGTNADGRLEIFYVGTNSDLFHNWQTSTQDTTQWFGETRFPGDKANEIAVVLNTDGRLEIVYVGTNNSLYHNWQAEPNGNWVGETQFPNVSASHVISAVNSDGRVETCYVGGSSHLFHDYQTEASAGWVNHNDLGGIAGAPALGSNSNYLISNCEFLVDVAVTINLTEDLFVEKAGFPGNAQYPPNLDPTNHGFSWQLNCYSPMGEEGDVTTWQQYGISLDWEGGTIYGWANNWSGDADDNDVLINKNFNLCSAPKSGIPAGFQLGVALLNDLNGNITGVTCWVVDDKGDMAGKETLILAKHGMKAADEAPITAFELNLVGEAELNESVFATGGGQIVYAVSTLMTAGSVLPQCVQVRFPTGETANSAYGMMSASPSNLLTQTFGVTAPEALIRAKAPRFRRRHKPKK